MHSARRDHFLRELKKHCFVYNKHRRVYRWGCSCCVPIFDSRYKTELRQRVRNTLKIQLEQFLRDKIEEP